MFYDIGVDGDGGGPMESNVKYAGFWGEGSPVDARNGAATATAAFWIGETAGGTQAR